MINRTFVLQYQSSGDWVIPQAGDVDSPDSHEQDQAHHHLIANDVAAMAGLTAVLNAVDLLLQLAEFASEYPGFAAGGTAEGGDFWDWRGDSNVRERRFTYQSAIVEACRGLPDNLAGLARAIAGVDAPWT